MTSSTDDDEGEPVCVPPRNALLLMRCRSAPLRLSLNSGCWKAPFNADERMSMPRLEQSMARKEVNFEGINFQEMPVIRLHECQVSCTQNNSCMGFAHNLDNGNCVYQYNTLLNGYWPAEAHTRMYLKVSGSGKEEPKQVIWDGHTGSIGRTANQAMTQNTGDEQIDFGTILLRITRKSIIEVARN